MEKVCNGGIIRAIMTEEERQLMMVIGKQASEAIERVSKLEKINISIPIKKETPVAGQSMESTIEFNKPPQHTKIEVVFEGDYTKLPYEERMKKTEDFLKHMTELFNRFGVVTFKGNYNKHGLVQ